MHFVKMANWITTLVLVIGLVLPNADGQLAVQLDLAIVIDGSGSVVDLLPEFRVQQQRFITQLLQDFVVSPVFLQVGVVTFDTTARVDWTLDTYSSSTENIRALNELQFTGSQSNIHLGIQAARTGIFGGSPGDREDVCNVMLSFSDGKSTLQQDLSETAALDARADGIQMISIGIGPTFDNVTLTYLSSGPEDQFSFNGLTDASLNGTQYRRLLSRLTNACQQPVQQNPCLSSPCFNQAPCSSSEDPYGWGFYCECSSNYGGRLCQIENPCVSRACPVSTVICIRTISLDTARLCFDQNFNNIAVDVS